MPVYGYARVSTKEQSGARPKEKPEGYAQCREARRSGEISAREAGRRLRVSHKTFLRWMKMEAADRKSSC